MATSASGRKERVPANMEGPGRDCAPQTHTPCGGPSAQSEDVTQRQVGSTPAAAGASAGCTVGAAEPRPPQRLLTLSADSVLFAYFCGSFIELQFIRCRVRPLRACSSSIPSVSVVPPSSPLTPERFPRPTKRPCAWEQPLRSPSPQLAPGAPQSAVSPSPLLRGIAPQWGRQQCPRVPGPSRSACCVHGPPRRSRRTSLPRPPSCAAPGLCCVRPSRCQAVGFLAPASGAAVSACGRLPWTWFRSSRVRTWEWTAGPHGNRP